MDNFLKAMRDAMFLTERVENLGRAIQAAQVRFDALASEVGRNITIRLKVSDDGEITLVDPAHADIGAAIGGEEE